MHTPKRTTGSEVLHRRVSAPASRQEIGKGFLEEVRSDLSLKDNLSAGNRMREGTEVGCARASDERQEYREVRLESRYVGPER